jgi:hypothetical protein
VRYAEPVRPTARPIRIRRTRVAGLLVPAAAIVTTLGYQEQLRREAIAKDGSAAQAARWVAAPSTSARVSGDAVDIGPANAAAWLSAQGAAYGLCRVYGNEPWHFELRPKAVGRGCPAMYADPTHDPRTQQ